MEGAAERTRTKAGPKETAGKGFNAVSAPGMTGAANKMRAEKLQKLNGDGSMRAPNLKLNVGSTVPESEDDARREKMKNMRALGSSRGMNKTTDLSSSMKTSTKVSAQSKYSRTATTMNEKQKAADRHYQTDTVAK